jgi:hypothetical protein
LASRIIQGSPDRVGAMARKKITIKQWVDYLHSLHWSLYLPEAILQPNTAVIISPDGKKRIPLGIADKNRAGDISYLHFDPVNLAELYLHRMPMDADIFLRYVLSDDMKTLVEEVGFFHPPNLTSCDDFSFEHWTIPPAFMVRSSALATLQGGGPGTGVYSPQVRRKRTYMLGEDLLKEETCLDAHTWWWETRYVKAGAIPDRWTNEILIEMLQQRKQRRIEQVRQRYTEMIEQTGMQLVEVKSERQIIRRNRPPSLSAEAFLTEGIASAERIAGRDTNRLYIGDHASEMDIDEKTHLKYRELYPAEWAKIKQAFIEKKKYRKDTWEHLKRK